MSDFLSAFQKEILAREGANVFFIAEYGADGIQTKALCTTNPCQNIYSIAKAFVVTAIGLLVDRGLLSTDELLTDLLADELPANYHSIWKKTSVERLLLHRVGLEKGFLDTYDMAVVKDDCASCHPSSGKGTDDETDVMPSGNYKTHAIDHIYSDRVLTVNSYRIIVREELLSVSDHCPTVIKFKL